MNVVGPRAAAVPSAGRAAPAAESFAAALAADPRSAPPLPFAGGAGDPPPLDAPGTVHRVALAVEVVRAGDRGRVDLRLEGGVAVQIDALPTGVSLTLIAPSPSAAVASAELAGLVAALRRRGVRVAGAQVRAAGRRGPGERPR